MDMDLGELQPVPWEDLETFPGFWKRVGGMFSLLFSKPLELADRVTVTGGLAPAWRFNILMALPYLGFIGLIFAFMGSVFAFAPPDPNMQRGLMAGIFIGEMLFIAAIILVGMFVYGAIAHAMLWMWGGMREGRGLGQTIRFCGYAWGFVHLGMVIPCFGGLVALAGLVYVGMGLARIHRTDIWRGICAILTPVLLCCLGYGLILGLVIGMSALKH
ncbi:MAG TPA: hypothetical protein VFF76_01175 [Holophagaceae bacterium]|jgi:hypothetical protein|nr:hypothetical protein [Holophagaceae bacterium]